MGLEPARKITDTGVTLDDKEESITLNACKTKIKKKKPKKKQGKIFLCNVYNKRLEYKQAVHLAQNKILKRLI